MTDANLVLGRLPAEGFLDGRMALEPVAAHAALQRLAAPLGCTPEVAALAVIAVANEQMARALRVISVERGVDPRGHTLVSFGGAGGLHVCALAEALGMRRALVPACAGVLSALGMLVARPGRVLTRAWLRSLGDTDEDALTRALGTLADQGAASLAAEGVSLASLSAAYSLDLRYRGQSTSLNIPWLGRAAALARFHDSHERRYGHRLDLPVELVNLRVILTGPAETLRLEAAAVTSFPRTLVRVWGCGGPVPLVRGSSLDIGEPLPGPAVVADGSSTTWVAPGWVASRDPSGNLALDRR